MATNLLFTVRAMLIVFLFLSAITRILIFPLLK